VGTESCLEEALLIFGRVWLGGADVVLALSFRLGLGQLGGGQKLFCSGSSIRHGFRDLFSRASVQVRSQAL
jgi:hypothetical protein